MKEINDKWYLIDRGYNPISDDLQLTDEQLQGIETIEKKLQGYHIEK